jgi:anti-sigma factor RsiW
MTPEQKDAALRALVIEIERGLLDDEECARRLAEIGATDAELEALIG